MYVPNFFLSDVVSHPLRSDWLLVKASQVYTPVRGMGAEETKMGLLHSSDLPDKHYHVELCLF